MRRILHLAAMLLISINLFAQAPQKMSYQAVIRNASNNLVTNAPVKMRISILQGSNPGTSVYSELHSATTNANGLVSIEIGEGTNKTGTFSSINWGNGTYFLKTETDPTNGSTYSIVGTSQLLSVPYALESKSAGDGIKGVSSTGDTVFLNNGKKYIIPGIKDLNAPSTINNGLVGYWPFNGNANDESGNGNNGTVNGATLTTDRFGASSACYSFNGSSGISIQNSSSFSFGNQSFSVSFWFKTTTNIAGDFISYDNCSTSAGWKIRINLPSGNQGGLDEEDFDNLRSPQGNVIYRSSLSNNLWHHVTFVRDVTNKLYKFYINGISVFTTQINSIQNITGTNIPLIFGNCNGIGYYIGNLDDIRIYNRSLTQEEITYLANN